LGPKLQEKEDEFTKEYKKIFIRIQTKNVDFLKKYNIKKYVIVKIEKNEGKEEAVISTEKNRSHGKVDKLPEVIRKEVENRLLEGHTYEEIAKYF